MKGYIALIRQKMIAQMQYRLNVFGRAFTNVFWGYTRTAIMMAYYTYGDGSAVIDVRQAVAMIWLYQMSLTMLAGISMDFDVWNGIRDGNVGYELLRPYDLYGSWYASALAVKVAPFLMSLLPIALVAYLTPEPFRLMPPASALHLLCCLASLMTGLALTCATICLSYAMVMDTRVGDAPARFFMMFVQIMAGSLLPLQLWPEAMQGFLEWQPFATMLDIPLRFYVGSAAPGELWLVVVKQFGWAVVFIAIGRFWIGRNLKKLVLQGG